MIAPSDSGLAKNRWACCHPGQVRGSGDPVILASPQGRPASSAAITAIPAAARSSRQASVGSPSHGSGPLMPRTGYGGGGGVDGDRVQPGGGQDLHGLDDGDRDGDEVAVAVAVPVAPMLAR